jgi:hypothetical protein
MKKMLLALSLTLIMTLGFPGCTKDTHQETTSPETTELGRMLGKVPYSFLENYDIFFGNLDQAKELNGVEDLNTSAAIKESLKQLPQEQYKQFGYDFSAAAGAFPNLNYTEQLTPLIGFDVLSFDSIAVINNIPPRVSCAGLGSFDDEFITGKLTEHGYTRTDYGSYSYYNYYYRIRDDFEIDLTDPLSKMVMASMNRVAVFDDLIVISPATEYVTGALDVMTSTVPSVMKNTAGRALADSLGDVLAAVITTPDRIITSIQDAENKPVFQFTVPAGWKPLHTYDMAALGYRADEDERFFDITLYYTDKSVAEADGKEIVARMSSYTLNTWSENEKTEKRAFLDILQPGEPVVTQYPDGAVLKIPCRFITEGPLWTTTFLGGQGLPVRDLLFLAPDPSEYIGKND